MNYDILLGGLISILTIIATKLIDYYQKSKELKAQIETTKINNHFSLSKTFFERKVLIAEKAIIYFNSLGNTLGLISHLFENLPKEKNELDEFLLEHYAETLQESLDYLTNSENETVNAISLYFDIDVQKFSEKATIADYSQSLSKLGVVDNEHSIVLKQLEKSTGTEYEELRFQKYLIVKKEYEDAFNKVSEKYEKAQADIFELVNMLRSEMKKYD